jgi:hypothetical protein
MESYLRDRPPKIVRALVLKKISERSGGLRLEF